MSLTVGAHEHHGHDHSISADADQKWLALALAITAGILVAEVVAGLIAHSLALLSTVAGHDRRRSA